VSFEWENKYAKMLRNMDIGIQNEIAGSNLKLNFSSEVNLRKEFS
jgi:hypothetical protein